MTKQIVRRPKTGKRMAQCRAKESGKKWKTEQSK